MRELDIYCATIEDAEKLNSFINCLGDKIGTVPELEDTDQQIQAHRHRQMVRIEIPESIEKSAGMSPFYWERLLLPKS